MRLCHIEIQGFRGIKEARITLPRYGVLMGPNNCGKTTIAEALAILLGKEQVVQDVNEYDFYGAMPTDESRFRIIATLTDLGGTDNDPSSCPEWFAMQSGGSPAWWLEDRQELSFQADCPEGGELAVQIGCAGRFDSVECKPDFRRFFVYGDTDPFVDPHEPVPRELLRDIGLFLLPSSRSWDRMLSFGSSTFVKMVRQSNAMPHEELLKVRKELLFPATRVEESAALGQVLDGIENELQDFFPIEPSTRIGYRVTPLDMGSILKSLTAHLIEANGSAIPFTRQGSGLVSLQMFLVLLGFAKWRKNSGKNVILIAEEPELHLHPSLQAHLIQRMRACADQCIITSHSPEVGGQFRLKETLYIRETEGKLIAQQMYKGNITIDELPNQVRRLFLRERLELYRALLGRIIVVPEGRNDWHWLTLWQRVAGSIMADTQLPAKASYSVPPSAITIVPSGGGSEIASVVRQLARFRNDLVVIVDGDSAGEGYCEKLEQLEEHERPKTIVKFGKGGEMEDLAAWIVEPSIEKPTPALERLIRGIEEKQDRSSIARELKMKNHRVDRKDNWDLHENIAWEMIKCEHSIIRVRDFMYDLAAIGAGQDPTALDWNLDEGSKIRKYTAAFVTGS